MRTTPFPLYLSRSRVRAGLLSLLILGPEKTCYLRELERRLKTSPGALARELGALSKERILLRKAGPGKVVLYQINPNYPRFQEMKWVVEKASVATGKSEEKNPWTAKAQPARARVVYIVAGPNGAGKTTFARRFLPEYVECRQFVNADLIAGGLSPFSPGELAIQAGKLLLDQIRSLAKRKVHFGFETTLSGKTYPRLLNELKSGGYRLQLFFLWIPNVRLALSRIRDRVRRGGHSIPGPVVERRFERGIQNLFHLYRSLVDSWVLLDNSGSFPHVIAAEDGEGLNILDRELFDKIQKQAGGSLK